jgi:Ca-activated chloride channel family protein
LDASASVDTQAWRLMLDGHAQAFTQPAVIRAAETGGLAVALIQFSDAPSPATWRILRTEAETRRYAAQIAAQTRQHMAGTNTGRAIHAALDAMESGPACETHVIDVATDGAASDWAEVRTARERAQNIGVRINAVGIVTTADPDPEQWLREEIITADGFAIVADGWGDFARAISRKIRMEIGAR